MLDLYKLFSVLLLMTGFLLTGHGQTKAAPPTRSATLLVDTDDACRLALDGTDQGVITPDQSKKIEVSFGDHVVKCTIESVPDLVWRKVIEVKTSDQIAAMVALKALHIQYDQAVAERNQAAVTAEKRQADAAAAAQQHANDEKGPTSATTMKFIQDTLNTIGTVSYSTTSPNGFTGGTSTFSTYQTVSDAQGSAEQCTLNWTETFALSFNPGEISVSPYTLILRDVLDVRVLPLSKFAQGVSEFRFSPEPYVVVINLTTPVHIHSRDYKKNKIKKERDDNSNILLFYLLDPQVATSVGKAIRYASGLCGAKQAAF